MIIRGSIQDKIPRSGTKLSFLHNRMKFAKPSFAFFRIQFAKKCENATDGHPCSVLCFFASQIIQSLFFLNQKFQAASLLWPYRPFLSDLIGNPKDMFPYVGAHIDISIVL